MTEKQTAKVLLLEDNPSDARMIIRMMARSRLIEFEVKHTEYVNSAIMLLDNPVGGQFDLIFADLNVQDSKGIETITSLNKPYPEIPIVVLSGYDDIKIADLTLHCGAEDFIVKRSPSDMYNTSRPSEEEKERATRTIADEIERKALFAIRRHKQKMTHDMLKRRGLEKTGAQPADPAMVQLIRGDISALDNGLKSIRDYLVGHHPQAWDALARTFYEDIEPAMAGLRLQTKFEVNASSKKVTVPGQDVMALTTLGDRKSPVPSSLAEAEAQLLEALNIDPYVLFGDQHE